MRRLNPEAIPQQDDFFIKRLLWLGASARALIPPGLGLAQPRPPGRM